MRMVADLKDMTRHHSYGQNEILDMTPFDYQAIKLMIAEDLKKEIDEMQGNNNG